jgi:hypothetical protein
VCEHAPPMTIADGDYETPCFSSLRLETKLASYWILETRQICFHDARVFPCGNCLSSWLTSYQDLDDNFLRQEGDAIILVVPARGIATIVKVASKSLDELRRRLWNDPYLCLRRIPRDRKHLL